MNVPSATVAKRADGGLWQPRALGLALPGPGALGQGALSPGLPRLVCAQGGWAEAAEFLHSSRVDDYKPGSHLRTRISQKTARFPTAFWLIPEGRGKTACLVLYTYQGLS